MAWPLLAAGTLFPLWLLLPTLQNLPKNNPVGNDVVFDALVVVLLLVGVVCVLARAWIDLAIALWMGFMLTNVRETYLWHTVSLLAWPVAAVVLPEKQARWAPRVRDARVGWYLFVAVLIYQYAPLPVWLTRLFQ